MNIKEYIESGTLEAYVLDALSAEERARVEADLAQYPELAAELAAIEETMYQFAQAQAKQPSANLQEKIWSAIDAPLEKKQSQSIPFPATPVTERNTVRIAASWILLAGSVALNAYLFFQMREQKGKQQSMEQTLASMQRQQDSINSQMTAYRSQMNMMADTNMSTVVMHSMKPGGDMYGMVYMDKAKGDVYLSLHNMPAAPAGKQYQLWVIQDGKPVDMGVIPQEMVTNGQLQKMVKGATGGQAFAISLEKEGGSPVPTMEQIFVLGKVS